MEEITIYKAVDGTRFDRKVDCEYYESIYKNVSNIMARLRPNDKVSSRVAIRQDTDVVREVREDFFLLCSEVIPSFKNLFMQVAYDNRHISHAGCVLSDYDKDFPILRSTCYRFGCINEFSGVEYEQPYFANHEIEFDGVII